MTQKHLMANGNMALDMNGQTKIMKIKKKTTMKILLFAAFAVTTLATCSNDDLMTEPYVTPEGKTTVSVLSASINDTPQTRASFERNYGSTDAPFFWTNNDAISVNYTVGTMSKLGKYELTDGAGTNCAKFEMPEFPSEGKIGDYALYPYNERHVAPDADGANGKFILPKSYTYSTLNSAYATSASSTTEKANYNSTNIPMLAKIDANKSLIFNHIAGMICFNVTNIPTDAKTFVFTVEKGITGSFDINDATTKAPSINAVKKSDGNNTVTIILNKPTTKGQNGIFYIPLPCGTYSGYTWEIKNGEKVVGSHTTTKSFKIQRGKLLPVATRQCINANGHVYVDLGVSVLWATMNVGASSEERYGEYFMWGQTKAFDWGDSQTTTNTTDAKLYYTDVNYTAQNIDGTTWGYFPKYNNGEGKRVLELTNDAANANWHGDWRMPTEAEWIELINKCTWKWTEKNGVYGRQVSGNGNSIFLPSAGSRNGTYLSTGGFGYYWSSSLQSNDSRGACLLVFGPEGQNMNYFGRYYGLNVRPVLPKND